MRVLLKVTFPVEIGNEAAANGTLAKTVESIVAEQKPEAVYFFAQDGKRGGFLVVNIKDTSEIPSYSEPWFLAFNATVELYPVMNAEDLARGASGIDRAAKKYWPRKSKAASAR